METPVLRRIYAFSDTYGRSKNPFLQDDADALISTDFRSFPLEFVRRDVDIYGREQVTAHMLRLIFQLQDELTASEYFPADVRTQLTKSLTGIFINWAPRLTNENGSPFYVATSGNIRIVTTSLAGLSTVKHRIETLHHLNNDKNIIYGPTEQFRSSYTAFLLHGDHNIDLIEDNVSIIPDEQDDLWELAYVDRFGNMITHAKYPEARWDEVTKAAAESHDDTVKLIVGNVSQRVKIGSSLRDAEPGSLVIYRNYNIDILRKWMADEDSYTRLYRSGYLQFSKPEIGAKIKVAA